MPTTPSSSTTTRLPTLIRAARGSPTESTALRAFTISTRFVERCPMAAPPLACAIIYELHIGTFTAEGTFDAAIGDWIISSTSASRTSS